MKLKNMKKKILMVALLFSVSLPIVTYAATSEISGTSGIAVAKYKLEGAQTKDWTSLPISTAQNNNYDFTLNTPGTTVVTLYAEDRAGNQNYTLKAFTITEGMTDAQVTKIEYRLTGSTVKDWTTYTGPFTISNEGITTVEAKVYDEAGNITNITQNIKLDKTSPVNTKAVITLE